MRQSFLFTKTRKNSPSDEQAKNAELLIRAGYVHKEMAGVYALLPLGLRTVEKIKNIIREELDAIGSQEIEMTSLQDPDLWRKTNRWDDESVDNWFKTQLKNGTELGVANTHEEPITNMLIDHVSSYRHLPLYVYQFQTKFRNELRAKSGLMRGREFLMKDLYSYSATEEEFESFYEQVATAYMDIFRRVGLDGYVFRTKAAGGSFTSKFTDEFQAVSNAGEDWIYLDRKKGLAINEEVYSEEVAMSEGLDIDSIERLRSIEVGNIFPLETKYSKGVGLTYKDSEGNDQYPIMGSYGIGIGRLLGTVVELLADDNGIILPESISPFKVHLISIGASDEVNQGAQNLYDQLAEKGCEVLWDDRDVSPGQKFNDSDLIGIPYQVVISERLLKNDSYEYKARTSTERLTLGLAEIINKISC